MTFLSNAWTTVCNAVLWLAAKFDSLPVAVQGVIIAIFIVGLAIAILT